MNPNDPQMTSPQQLPPDYLNQIAVAAPIKTNFLLKKPVFIGGIAIILLISFVLLAFSMSGGKKPAEQLAINLLSTQTITNDSSKNIKSTQLRSLNSNLKIYLTNTIRDISPLLVSDNVKIETLSKNIKTDKPTLDVMSRLNDARLNAVFDRTYAREIAYQLDTTMALMKKIYESTSNSDLKEFLATARTNLAPTQQQFADYNAANS